MRTRAAISSPTTTWTTSSLSWAVTTEIETDKGTGVVLLTPVPLSTSRFATGLRRPGSDNSMCARPERGIDGKGRGCYQAGERDGSANLERAWFVAVNQAVDAIPYRSASHQAVDLVDRCGLAVDRQFPAGIVNVREDDDSRGLEVHLELDALGTGVRNLDRLGGARRLSAQKGPQFELLVLLDPDQSPWIERGQRGIVPDAIIAVQNLLHGPALLELGQSLEIRQGPRIVNYPGAGINLAVAPNLVIMRFDPVFLLGFPAALLEEQRINEFSFVEKGGVAAVLIHPAVGIHRKDEVAGVPHIERAAREVDHFLARLGPQGPGDGFPDLPREPGKKPFVVEKLGRAQGVCIFDPLRDPVLRLDRSAFPGHEVANPVRRGVGAPPRRVPERHSVDAERARRWVLPLGLVDDPDNLRLVFE